MDATLGRGGVCGITRKRASARQCGRLTPARQGTYMKAQVGASARSGQVSLGGGLVATAGVCIGCHCPVTVHRSINNTYRVTPG